MPTENVLPPSYPPSPVNKDLGDIQFHPRHPENNWINSGVGSVGAHYLNRQVDNLGVEENKWRDTVLRYREGHNASLPTLNLK